MDYTTMSRSELHATYQSASNELAERQTLDVFFDQLADMQDNYAEAFGVSREDGEEWSECDYPLPAYRRGDVVTHGQYEYRSNIPCNTFSPSDRGWRRLGNPMPFVEPKYDHDSYMKGDKVKWGESTYRATEDYVMDKPSKSSELWEFIEEEEEPEVGDE